MKVLVTASNTSNASTLVLFASQKNSQAVLSGQAKLAKELLSSASDFTGAAKSTVFFRNNPICSFKNVLFVGLGADKSAEGIRQAASHAFKKLRAEKISDAAFSMDSLGNAKKLAEHAQAATEALVLSNYSFDDHKKKPEKKAKDMTIDLLCEKKPAVRTAQKGIDAGQILADATNFSRWLGDSPGNKMTPTILANSTIKEAKGTKLKVTALNKTAISKKKMGGLMGVAAGSSEEPRFIIMEYKGAAASRKPLCLVGKGLTFDCGGISIKPSPGMEEMKYDMCGGANVIGAMIAIARLKLKVNVTALVPASENMPGPAATKPGDILTFMNGATAEVNNTDAEGRLILADALCYANTLKPAAIVDAATLTGAMVVALGSSHTGIYTNNNKLMKKINDSADNTGERVWQMPLVQDHSDDIKGTYADISNIGKAREAGSATAAAFLKHFVDPDTPWAHCDIAGTGWHTGKRLPYNPAKGASGCMVRTFVELAKKF